MKILIILFITVSLPIVAQNEPINTDRPDITESPVTIPVNKFQVESGFILQNLREETPGITIDTRSFSLFGTLLRYGLFDDLELRLESEYLFQRITALNSVNLEGMNGLVLGTKFQFIKNNPVIPDLALLLNLNFPVGNKDITGEKTEPEIILALAHDFTENISISGNVGATWDMTDSKSSYLYSISTSISISDKIDSFFELYGTAANELKPDNNIDFGFTYLIQNNFQVDISTGINIDKPGNNWFLSTGAGFRFPD